MDPLKQCSPTVPGICLGRMCDCPEACVLLHLSLDPVPRTLADPDAQTVLSSRAGPLLLLETEPMGCSDLSPDCLSETRMRWV